MGTDRFHLKWEQDEKHRLVEKVENRYDEASWNEAVSLYKEALERQPGNPEYLFAYGYLLEMKAIRLLREGADCYQTGLESEAVQQEYAWIGGKLHHQLIAARARLLETRLSVDFYKKQLSLRPDDPRLYGYLAQCYLATDQISEARQVVEAGMKLFPSDALLHYYMGEVYARRGCVEQALHAWGKSALLEPQLVDGRFSRAYLLEREKRLLEAADEWRFLIEVLGRYGLNADGPKQELARIEKRIAENPQY